MSKLLLDGEETTPETPAAGEGEGEGESTDSK